MDTTNSAIAKLIAEAREQMKEQSRKGNHWFPSMTAWKLADTLEAVTIDRDEALAFKAWIRKKLESSSLCEPRTDELVATDSEIFGWMHVIVGNAQSWKNILPMVDKRHHEQQDEINRLTVDLEAVMRERDFALVREDLAVKVFQQEQDNVIALQSQIKAVTRERDALLKNQEWDSGVRHALLESQERLVLERDALREQNHTASQLISEYMLDDDYDAQNCLNKVRDALASRAAPQEK